MMHWTDEPVVSIYRQFRSEEEDARDRALTRDTTQINVFVMDVRDGSRASDVEGATRKHRKGYERCLVPHLVRYPSAVSSMSAQQRALSHPVQMRGADGHGGSSQRWKGGRKAEEGSLETDNEYMVRLTAIQPVCSKGNR